MIENETIKALTERFSCKRFKSDPVDKEILDTILNAAKYAASGHNAQGWHFTVIQSQEAKDLLLASVCDEPENFKKLCPPGATWPFPADFYGAPVVIMISGKTDVPWPLAGPYLAAGNIMTAAQSLGLSATWLTVYSQDVFTTEKTARNKSKFVPEGYEVRATLVLGYPESIPTTRPKRVENVETWL